jgi:hypothetical protein
MASWVVSGVAVLALIAGCDGAGAGSDDDGTPVVDGAPPPIDGEGTAIDAMRPDGWQHSRPIRLDTSATGAAISEDVADYPLAILLDADSLDFAQASDDGRDLRFFAGDGAPLPHSIEAWDAAARKAAVWVRLDLRGNDATQTITMAWGNPDAEDASDPHAVFPTDEGYVAVWHLGDDFRDATANAADLTGVNLEAGATTDGRIGKAVALEHDDRQWLRLDGNDKNALFDVHQQVTYSLWVRPESHTVDYQCAFSKGETGFRIHYYGSSEWDDNHNKHIMEPCVEAVGGTDLCPLRGGNENAWQGTDVAPGSWWHLTIVHDHPNISFYINGELEVTVDWGGTWTSGAARPVAIGNNSSHSDGRRSWDGAVDEVRFLARPRSASWIKLDYESQRADQQVVHFE